MKPDEFDQVLMEQIGELPPTAGEVDRCTPWSEAMAKLLLGQALVTFRFEFLYLQYFLPLLGTILIYLGSRSLRKENRYFRLCWILGGARLVWHVAGLILDATPAIQWLTASGLYWPASILVSAVNIVQLLALYGGTRLAFVVTGGPKPKDWLARGLAAYLLSAAIAIWGTLVPLTQSSIFGQAIIHEWSWLYYGRGIVFIVLQIYFLSCLFRQGEALAGRGFGITPVPVRFSGKAVGLAVFGLVALAIPIALFFSSHISIGPVEAVTEPLAGEQVVVRDKLVEMGLLEEIAEILDESDLTLCADAVEVRLMEASSQTLDEGRSEKQGDWLIDSLSGGGSAMTAWAVVLPENHVRYYFLFRYLDMPVGHFQDQFSIDPIGNYPTWNYAARLIWSYDGAVQTVRPQVHLAGGQTEEEIDWDAVWFEEDTRRELERLGGRLHVSPWFDFSIPKGAEDLRGYLAYTVDLGSASVDFYDSAYAVLRHQSSPLHYPFFPISDFGGGTYVADYANVESAWQLFMLYGNLPES